MPPKTSKNLKAAAPSKKAAAPSLKNSAPRNAGKAAKAKKKKHAPNRKHAARPSGSGSLSNKGVLRELVRDGREEDIVADKWTTSLINPFMYAPPYLGTAGVSTSYMQTYGRKIYTASDFTAGADTLMILIPPQNTGFWSRITTSTGSGAFSATTLTNSSNVAASYTGRCTAWGLKWSMDIPDSEVTPFVFAGVMPLRENITTALTAASPAFVNGSMNYPILTGARALTGYIGGRPLSGTAGTGGQLDMSQQWIATSPTVYPIAAYPYFCIQGVSSTSQIKLCLEFVQHWETLNTPFNGGAGAAYSTNAVKFHDIDSILERMYDRHGRALQNPVKLHPTVFTTCNTTGTMTTTNFVDGATSDGSGSLSRSNFDPVAQKYKESEYNSLITHAVGAAGLGATYLMNRLYRVAGVPGPRHPPGGYRVQAQAFWVHAPNPNPGPAPSSYRAVTLAEIDPSHLQAFDPSVQAASQRFFNYVRSGWLERYGIGSERKWYAKFDQNGEYITLADNSAASAFETQASVHSAGWRNIGHLADEISRRDAGAIASAHGWGGNQERLMWSLLDDASKQTVLDQVNSALVPAGSSGNHLGGFSIIGDGGRVTPLPIMVSNTYAQFLVAQAAEEQRKKQMENVINNVTRIRIEDVTDAPASTRHSSFSDIGEEEKAVDLTQSTVLKAVQNYLRK